MAGSEQQATDRPSQSVTGVDPVETLPAPNDNDAFELPAGGEDQPSDDRAQDTRNAAAGLVQLSSSSNNAPAPSQPVQNMWPTIQYVQHLGGFTDATLTWLSDGRSEPGCSCRYTQRHDWKCLNNPDNEHLIPPPPPWVYTGGRYPRPPPPQIYPGSGYGPPRGSLPRPPPPPQTYLGGAYAPAQGSLPRPPPQAYTSGNHAPPHGNLPPPPPSQASTGGTYALPHRSLPPPP